MSIPRYIIVDRSATTILFDTKHLIEPIAKVLLDDQPSSAVWAWADAEPDSPAYHLVICHDRPDITDIDSIPEDMPDGYWVLRIATDHHSGAPAIANGTPLECLKFLLAQKPPQFVAAMHEHHLKNRKFDA